MAYAAARKRRMVSFRVSGISVVCTIPKMNGVFVKEEEELCKFCFVVYVDGCCWWMSVVCGWVLLVDEFCL